MPRPANADARAAETEEIPLLPSGVTLTSLDNGLVVIVREDPSAPVVSAQAWCQTGSIHEDRWLGAGLSHVLEHMLFKGTARRTGAQLDQEVQAAGGSMNAYTSFDRTVYWINVPSTGTTVALDVLADIMQHATLPPDELAKELEVIRRELDMNQDDPGRRSSRRLFETAYTTSPYRYPIIGCPALFSQLQPEDIHRYYRERYVPNNCFFVVAGDVTAESVIEQIRQGYDGRVSGVLPPLFLPAEPPQTAPREVTEEGAVELGQVHFSWHIPDLRHPDVPQLDVLATLLGAGRSSRLHRQIRERLALAHVVEAWTYSPGNPGLLGISAVADGGQFPALRVAVLAEVDKVLERLISPAELKKATKQFVAATLATRKTMQGQAQELGGNWLAARDLSFSERYLAAVKRTTPQDLQRVAQKYLTPENRTLYALLPKGTAPRVAALTPATPQAAIQKFELATGLRLLVKEDRRLPFVELRAVFRGGVLAEIAANNGIACLMAKTLLQGTRNRSALQIDRQIETLGGHLDTFSGNNSFGLSVEVLKDDFRIGLTLLVDVMRHPLFANTGLERERAVQLAGLKAQRDQLLQSAFRTMRHALFGPGGYGLDVLGTESSVAAITRQHLHQFHRTFTTPDNCVLAIYGDLSSDRAVAEVRRLLDGWKRAPGTAVQTGAPAARGPVERRVRDTRDKQQAVVVIGFPGTTLLDPDRYALDLVQEACSDLGSRLFLRVRDKLGLAYYVGAQNFAGLVPGYFAFYAGTAPEHAARVEQELLEEARLLREAGLEPEELQRAKAKTVGQRKIARQDLGNLANLTALDELYGLGYDNFDREDARYEAVTVEDTVAVSRRYLDPQTAVVSVIEPA